MIVAILLDTDTRTLVMPPGFSKIYPVLMPMFLAAGSHQIVVCIDSKTIVLPEGWRAASPEETAISVPFP